MSVTQSRDWSTGTLQTWNTAPGLIPEINEANSSCKAPPGTVVLWLHLKTTAKKAGQGGSAKVRHWRVGRCTDDDKCSLRWSSTYTQSREAGDTNDTDLIDIDVPEANAP